MATKDDDAGPLLCADCAALPAVDGLLPFPGMCARCGEVLPDEQASEGGEDAIERARRGPVPPATVDTAAQERAVIDEAVAWYKAIKPGAGYPSPAILLQTVRELLDVQEGVS